MTRKVPHIPDADIPDPATGTINQFRYCAHENALYSNIVQPSAPLILARNKRLRDNPGSLRDLSFARHMMEIPTLDYSRLKEKYPVIVNGDADQVGKFWRKFYASSESLKYRVQ